MVYSEVLDLWSFLYSLCYFLFVVVTQGANIVVTKGEHGCGARGEHGCGTRRKRRCGARGEHA